MNTLKRFFLVLIIVSPFLSVQLRAEAKTIFKGRPVYGINEFGFRREAGPIESVSQASSAEVVISEIGGKYYWASRENRELRKIVGGNPHGSIVTFFAIDGSGYIRVMVGPTWKDMMRTRFPDYDLDYTEHMLQALGTWTYFGREKKGT